MCGELDEQWSATRRRVQQTWNTTPRSTPAQTGPTDFTLPAPAIDTLLFCFNALTIDESVKDFKTILSPRKPKVKPGPRKKPLSPIPHKVCKASYYTVATEKSVYH